MSEYWKSTLKYWCKHCSTYVKDTPFERKQHETTAKHQGNLKRFLRGIQNDHEKAGRDKEKAKAEVVRLNRVVGGESSSVEASTSKTNAVRKPNPSAPTAADQKRQWAQLAEMGIQVPDNFGGEMAMPGQWQTISKRSSEEAPLEDSLSVGIRKREIEGEEDEEEAGQATERRGWGNTTRRYPETSDADLDALLNGSIMVKEDSAKSESAQDNLKSTKGEPKSSTSGTDVEVKQLTDETKDKSLSGNATLTDNHPIVKNEAEGIQGQAAFQDIPSEDAAPVFKKRKLKSKAAKATK